MKRVPTSEGGGDGRLLRASLAFGVAGSFLLFSPRQSEGFGLVKLLVMATAACSAWTALAAGWGVPPARTRPTRLGWPLAACGAAFVASLAGSTDPFVGLVGMYSTYSYGLLSAIVCAALFYATAWSDEPERPGFLLGAALVAGGLSGLYAALQKAGIEPFFPTQEEFGGRVGSTLGVPVPLGACLLMTLPIAAAFTRGGSARRALGWACGALAALGLVFTYSRGAWLGASAGVLVYAVASGRLRPWDWSRARKAAAAAAGAAFVALLFGIVARVRTVGKSDRARWELWRSSCSMVRAYPWLGTGPDTFQAALRRHRTEGLVRELGSRGSQLSAHNDLLQVWATMGTVGLAAYLWLLAAAFLVVRDALAGPRREEAAAVAGALAGLFVQAKFNPVPLPALAMSATFLGLLAGGPPAAGNGGGRRLAKAAAACLALGIGALALRLGAADRVFLTARRLASAGRLPPALKAFREAARLNPYETYYRLLMVGALYDASGKAPAGPARLEFLEAAVEQGRLSVRFRPAVADGYVILGTYLMLHRLEGGPDRLEEADRALETASRLDPLLIPLIENRYKLALLRGLHARAETLKLELDRVQAINPR